MAMWHAAGFYSGQKLLPFCPAFQCTKHSLESKTFFKKSFMSLMCYVMLRSILLILCRDLLMKRS